jgi:hypothetical protein
MNYYDPEPARCVVCDARNPAGAACMGTWCPRERAFAKSISARMNSTPATPCISGFSRAAVRGAIM